MLNRNSVLFALTMLNNALSMWQKIQKKWLKSLIALYFKYIILFLKVLSAPKVQA